GPVPLEDNNFRIIEEPLPGRATEVGRRPHERAEERVHRHVEAKFAPCGARPREHHQEEPQGACAAAGYGGLPHVRPVNLGLLAYEWVKTQERFAFGFRADALHEAAERARAALEAPRAHHIQKARRAQVGISLQLLGNKARIARDQSSLATWLTTR